MKETIRTTGKWDGAGRSSLRLHCASNPVDYKERHVLNFSHFIQTFFFLFLKLFFFGLLPFNLSLHFPATTIQHTPQKKKKIGNKSKNWFDFFETVNCWNCIHRSFFLFWLSFDVRLIFLCVCVINGLITKGKRRGQAETGACAGSAIKRPPHKRHVNIFCCV